MNLKKSTCHSGTLHYGNPVMSWQQILLEHPLDCFMILIALQDTIRSETFTNISPWHLLWQHFWTQSSIKLNKIFHCRPTSGLKKHINFKTMTKLRLSAVIWWVLNDVSATIRKLESFMTRAVFLSNFNFLSYRQNVGEGFKVFAVETFLSIVGHVLRWPFRIWSSHHWNTLLFNVQKEKGLSNRPTHIISDILCHNENRLTCTINITSPTVVETAIVPHQKFKIYEEVA